ncbi:hypothetical protein Slin15195_G047400 [Septoria linicola]|uniref:Uncharacterized protein n=1 Tax=Septoria linicola TaxID=215465 RepID=A0A9Q9EH38_9PEZI|nr:hypothetical protein Slin15195_G047400 [Septoria linicola]
MSDLKTDLSPSDNLSQAPSSRRSSFSSIDSDDKLPPSYTEVAGKDQAPAYDGLPGSVRFPARFNLYHKKTSWRCTIWTLGEHFSHPLFAVVLNSGWKGTKFVLHHGPDGSSPVLAEMGSKRYMSIHNMISLPGHEIVEELRTKLSFQSASYTFTAPVLHGEKIVPERFCWRQSHGKEVQQLTVNKYAWGWKLVRLDSDDGTLSAAMPNDIEASSSKGGKRADRDLGETSDGKEVVAVWADNMKWSKNKLVRFEFMGSGSTREMGEAFEIMAVSSGLRIWQILRTGTSGGGISAAADAGASAAVGT